MEPQNNVARATCKTLAKKGRIITWKKPRDRRNDLAHKKQTKYSIPCIIRQALMFYVVHKKCKSQVSTRNSQNENVDSKNMFKALLYNLVAQLLT